MSPEELKTILDDHAKWLRGDGGKQANLSGANLSGADLSEANLSGANLSWANLSEANLRGANLAGADLSEANLSWANLAGANLSWANLSEANLAGAIIDLPICRMDFGGWSICVYGDRTSIGCRTHPNECWLAWGPDSPEIVRMHSDASVWWATHGEAIKGVIRCVMAKAKKGGDA